MVTLRLQHALKHVRFEKRDKHINQSQSSLNTASSVESCMCIQLFYSCRVKMEEIKKHDDLKRLNSGDAVESVFGSFRATVVRSN